MHQLTADQISIIETPSNQSIFVAGPAGSGKTTAGKERIKFLIENGVPAQKILVLIPQRSLGDPYSRSFSSQNYPPGGIPELTTLGGVARRMTSLFWPLASQAAGFGHPNLEPNFLTMENSQYFMAHLVRPLIEDQGYFSSVTIQRNRLYSQILDNLNKSAIKNFDFREIGQRLISSWIGEPGQTRVFEDAQECAVLFREFCLENNLLDYSLQMEVFLKYISPRKEFIEFFQNQFRHLIYDNSEEDIPVAHQFVANWLPEMDSSLLIFDSNAGYRSFLGADPDSAKSLASFCDQTISFQTSLVNPPGLTNFHSAFVRSLQKIPLSFPSPSEDLEALRESYSISYHSYIPEMIDWLTVQCGKLIESGTSPSEIAILSPFLSDSLRFLIENRFQESRIRTWSHRPSRALREEPATRCLLTLAALAHPVWGIKPSIFDLTYAFIQAVENLDLARAQLLAKHAADYSEGFLRLSNFEDLAPDDQDRISFTSGIQVQAILDWIDKESSRPDQPLDHFFSRLFGEILSQPGFGFHDNYDRAKAASNLIDSSKNFRETLTKTTEISNSNLGREYFHTVQEGILSDLYHPRWEERPEDAVFLAPSYTFLINNYPVSYQFWLDTGSRGWYERIFQPLTHPYVLSPDWEIGRTWTDEDEIRSNQEFLEKLVTGLIRRCKQHITFCLSEHDERGYEQNGLLIQTLNNIQHQIRHDRYPAAGKSI